MADKASDMNAPRGLDCNTVFVAAPRALDVNKYVTARAQEMEAMASVSSRVWGNNKAMQTLPRHMRRRAASHNVKRLPRRLRKKGEREMQKSGPPVNAKRPGRYHRRRPANLLQEYARRARKNVWLETHIWHAKRFHMTDRWGYRIPLHRNDKGIRAAYRGAGIFCIMQDTSFLCCIEIRGLQNSILDSLSRLIHPELGPGFGSLRYISGNREGSIIIHQHDQYPSSAIGPVKFLWRSTCESTSNESHPRQLWLWVHPSCYRQTMLELKTVFKLREVASKNTTHESSNKIDEKHTGDKPEPNMREKDTKEQRNESEKPEASKKKTVDDFRRSAADAETFTNGDVTVTSLKDLLCRFHLCGPLSHAILKDLLQVADICHKNPDSEEDQGERKDICESHMPAGTLTGEAKLEQSERMGDVKVEADITQGKNITERGDGSRSTKMKSFWWRSYYTCRSRVVCHGKQEALWEEMAGLQSAGELGANVVLGLTVRDPRVFLPRKRMRVENDEAAVAEFTLDCVKRWPTDISSSPLWDKDIRHQVKTSRLTEQEMNALRAQHLIPGTPLELGDEESRIPILLIQHPGSSALRHQHHLPSKPGLPQGWGAGWDIVLPQNWAMAFWIGLIYRGARATGLKESLSTFTELGQLHFPESFPDTEAGREFEKRDKLRLESQYKRIPPAKRPNYTKLGSVTPFHCPWAKLVSEWRKESRMESPQSVEMKTEEIVVLRNKKSLCKLDKLCVVGSKSVGFSAKVKRTGLGQMSVHDKKNDLETQELDQVLPALTKGCLTNLVSVRVRAVQRGTMNTFSMICIPSKDDLAALSNDRKYCGPLEASHIDPDYSRKKDRLKAKTKRAKEGTPQASGPKVRDSVKTEASGVLRTSAVEKGATPKNEDNSIEKCSGLVTDVTAVRHSCSRQVAGYVTQGGYHLGDGQGAGVGFMVLAAFTELLKGRGGNSPLVALVRSPRSNQYRFVTLSLVL